MVVDNKRYFGTQEKRSTLQFITFLIHEYRDGKTIQFSNTNVFEDWNDIVDDHTFTQAIQKYPTMTLLRIKPELKKVPLTADDIPAVCWLRWKNAPEKRRLAIYFNNEYITAMGRMGSFFRTEYKELMTAEGEYSSDLKSWKPCYKEIAE